MPNIPIQFPWTKSWSPELDLTSPAGLILQEVVRLLPEGERLTLFGSAPLQLALDRQFLSVDVDCFGSQILADAVRKSGLGNPANPIYVQVCSELNFRASPRWKDRTHSFVLSGRTVVIPHPIDILIAKLSRMAKKDLKAFELVRRMTGHPTEEEMIQELQLAVDLFRPSFDEEQGQDMKTTTRILWQSFFGKDIDVSAVIIRPALEIRRLGYEPDTARSDYKNTLRLV